MKLIKKLFSWIPGGIVTLAVFFLLFGYLGSKMGAANMLNTMMNTSHDLLLNTVFYLMAICVLTGAIGKIFVEFGVVKLLEKLLRPLMKPLFNLPGVASLGAVLTFLSDNPAIISLAQDKKFASYFKKYQFISLNNFGTSFGMGLLVIVFMIGQGYFMESFVGFIGAMVGCIVSTRLMQHFVIKAYPHYKTENAVDLDAIEDEKDVQGNKPLFQRILDSLLDGGRSGVDVGMVIIPGVLVISTLVMIFTFGPDPATGEYTGAAKEGVKLLPWIGEKLSLVFEGLFGFTDPHLIAFPITAIGAVGAALGLVPDFASQGWIDGNAIAVFTAIGMCWSGFLSTHTAMLDALGYRKLTSKDILSHTIGGLVAGIVAHWIYVLVSMFFVTSSPVAQEQSLAVAGGEKVTSECVAGVSQADSLIISSFPVAQEQQALVLVDGEKVACEWVAGTSEWTPVQADSLQNSISGRNIAFRTVDMSVAEPGYISVNFMNNKGKDALTVLGADVVDAQGNAISASYMNRVTNDSLGCVYALNDVLGGACQLRYFAENGAALDATSGVVTLGFVSHRKVAKDVLDYKLKKARFMSGANVETKEQAVHLTLLQLLCDKYEPLLANPDATVVELETACKEIDRFLE